MKGGGSMNNETIASLLFIGLSFILKCLVGRVPTFGIIIPYLIELPMDIIFLSIGCTASLIIAQKGNTFIFFLAQIIAAIAITFLCRTSVDTFGSTRKIPSLQEKQLLQETQVDQTPQKLLTTSESVTQLSKKQRKSIVSLTSIAYIASVGMFLIYIFIERS